MSDHSKATADQFIQRVKAGEYDNSTNAKRAIGRSQMSDADKDRCRKYVDNNLDTGVPSAPKKAAKKASKKVGKKASKKASKKADAAPLPIEKQGRKKRPRVASSGGAAIAKGRSTGKPASSEGEDAASTPIELGQESNDMLSRINLLRTVVTDASNAIKALDMGREVLGSDPKAIALGVQLGCKAITGALHNLSDLTSRLSSSGDQPQEGALLTHSTTVHSTPATVGAFASMAPANGVGGHAPPPPLPAQPAPVVAAGESAEG